MGLHQQALAEICTTDHAFGGLSCALVPKQEPAAGLEQIGDIFDILPKLIEEYLEDMEDGVWFGDLELCELAEEANILAQPSDRSTGHRHYSPSTEEYRARGHSSFSAGIVVPRQALLDPSAAKDMQWLACLTISTSPVEMSGMYLSRVATNRE